MHKPPAAFKAEMKTICEVVDMFFWANPERQGWVEIYANDVGRTCVNNIFPNAQMDFTPAPPEWPVQGWGAFEVDLPSAAEIPLNRLSPITDGTPLSQCKPAALAFLLAASAYAQGCRAAAWTDGGFTILTSKGRCH
jgi:hypothetical protein